MRVLLGNVTAWGEKGTQKDAGLGQARSRSTASERQARDSLAASMSGRDRSFFLGGRVCRQGGTRWRRSWSREQDAE